MQGVQRRFWRKWFLVCLLAVFCLLTGCVHQKFSVKNDNIFGEKDVLKKTFNQYWRNIAGKEVEKAFAREAPYVQEMISEDTYRLYQKLFLKAELQEVEIYRMMCEKPFLCCVDCRMVYDFDGKKDVRDRRDCWVLVDGDWYHIFKSPILFPF